MILPRIIEMSTVGSHDACVEDLVRMSRAVGRDGRLIQGGGGNTSVKSADGALMWVKASGTALGQMRRGAGYRAVRVAEAAAMLHDEALAALPSADREREVLARLLAACADDLPGRPSVETSLHAFLGRCVIHIHPAAANGLACARRGQAAAGDIFRNRPRPPLFVRYTDPGVVLARSTHRAVRRYTRAHGGPPEVIFLGNHGVFVSTSTAREALALSREIDRTVRREWAARYDPAVEALPRWTRIPPARRRRLAAGVTRALKAAAQPHLGRRLTVIWNEGPDVRRFLRDRDAAKLCRAGPLTPDHMVYAHGAPMWIEDAESPTLRNTIQKQVAASLAHFGTTARCALAAGVGLFTVGGSRERCASAEAITLASLTTLLVAKAFGGPRGLTPRAARYINEWEVEEFRRRSLGRA